MAINEILLTPSWFISLESLFYIISMIVTFAISFYSYKVYKLSENRSYKYLFVSFFAISFGFLFKILSNLMVLYYDKLSPYHIFNYLKLSYIYTGSLVLYAFLILGGYIILACLASKVSNRKVIFSLLLISLLCAVLVDKARSFTFFYFFSFVLLVVYIIPYMYENYQKKKIRSSYLVFSSFLLLGIANFSFIIRTVYPYLRFYALGQFISLIAFIILLISFILVLKK